MSPCYPHHPDWGSTEIPGLFYCPSENSYNIVHTTINSVILQHRQIQRFHGREKTDHPYSAYKLYLPLDTLWSVGPTDVGLCPTVEPKIFAISHYTLIWQSQCNYKTPADEGIQDTVEGLLASGGFFSHGSCAKWTRRQNNHCAARAVWPRRCTPL